MTRYFLVRDIMIMPLIIIIDIAEAIRTWFRRSVKAIADWWTREDILAEAIAWILVLFDIFMETDWKRLIHSLITSTRKIFYQIRSIACEAWMFRKEILYECRTR